MTLENHNSGYTLHRRQFIPVTNTVQIGEIKRVETNTNKYGLKEVRTHLETALKFLSNKPEPDLPEEVETKIDKVNSLNRNSRNNKKNKSISGKI